MILKAKVCIEGYLPYLHVSGCRIRLSSGVSLLFPLAKSFEAAHKELTVSLGEGTISLFLWPPAWKRVRLQSAVIIWSALWYSLCS